MLTDDNLVMAGAGIAADKYIHGFRHHSLVVVNIA